MEQDKAIKSIGIARVNVKSKPLRAKDKTVNNATAYTILVNEATNVTFTAWMIRLNRTTRN